MIYDSK